MTIFPIFQTHTKKKRRDFYFIEKLVIHSIFIHTHKNQHTQKRKKNSITNPNKSNILQFQFSGGKILSSAEKEKKKSHGEQNQF